jgi:hypothetical protein
MNIATFIGQLRTLLLVGFITALVWLMAESESLRTEKLRPEVRFRVPPDAPRLVRVEPGQEFSGTVTVTIEGPTAAVDALAARARGTIDLEPGMVGVPAEPGRHSVNLADALRAHEYFRDSSVTITSVDPPSATVWVDEVVAREASVKIETPEGALLAGVADVKPPKVEVRLPESIARTAAPPGTELTLTARLTPEALANLPAGRRIAVTVPLTLPPTLQSDAVRVSPPQVNVELTLRSRAASTIVPNVPVYVRVAPTEVGVWDVDLAPEGRVLTDVTITGPADQVDQFRAPPEPPGAAPKVKLIGYVPLSFEELEKAATSGQPLEKDVAFCDVPTPLRFDARPRTVKVTVRRSTPMGPPAPR